MNYLKTSFLGNIDSKFNLDNCEKQLDSINPSLLTEIQTKILISISWLKNTGNARIILAENEVITYQDLIDLPEKVENRSLITQGA